MQARAAREHFMSAVTVSLRVGAKKFVCWLAFGGVGRESLVHLRKKGMTIMLTKFS